MPKGKSIKRYYHRKLVRDKILEIIESKGDSYKARELNVQQYRKQLRKKLVEEAKELLDSPKKALLKELSDVLQLLKSIAEFEGIYFREIEVKRKEREKKRGGFKKKIYLIWSNKPSGKK